MAKQSSVVWQNRAGRLLDGREWNDKMDDDVAVRLLALLNSGGLRQLVELLEEVINDTGWGGVEIVMAERRLVRLKVVKSFARLDELDSVKNLV